MKLTEDGDEGKHFRCGLSTREWFCCTEISVASAAAANDAHFDDNRPNLMGRTASFVSAYRVGAFRYVASVGGGPVGEIVRFVEENGRVTRMITGDSYVERVPPTIGNIRAVSRLP